MSDRDFELRALQERTEFWAGVLACGLWWLMQACFFLAAMGLGAWLARQ